MIYAVIGSNYGDEGKGLATDFLALKGAKENKKTLVIRHNGGAQSGHTVETSGLRPDHYDSKRVVFNELSSGSFRGADTYWASSYHPDMFKLSEELNSFYYVAGFIPRVFASPDAVITIVDDILINMLAETSRGEGRHGSCGMGIWECFLRQNAGFGITLGFINDNEPEVIAEKLKEIRKEYVLPRIESEGIDMSIDDELCEMLNSENVLVNFAERIKSNMKYVKLVSNEREFFDCYDDIVFEGGQGLCLDAENKANLPHVTASRTGLTNPVEILRRNGLKLDEAIYITRTYVTKHGAGPLPNENYEIMFDYDLDDMTNVFNPWQGDIRYAKFTDSSDIVERVREDLKICDYDVKKSLFITHINETSGDIILNSGNIPVSEYVKLERVRGVFDKFYLSNSKYSTDVEEM